MKCFNNKLSKVFGLLTLCWVVSISAMAQTQGYIIPVTSTSTCIPVTWHNASPIPIPYHLTGMTHSTNSYMWYTSGDLQIDSISADALTAYVSSASSNSLREKDFGKGRIWATYWEDTISNICGNPIVYYDVYKTFKDTVTPIAGPECINEGDTVTYSIDAMVSVNLNSNIGVDHYYWDWSESLIDEILYFSGDSSSITFRVGAITGNDTIFVDMGQCNKDDDFRYTKALGQSVTDPVFVDGFEPPTCMPFSVTSDTIIFIPQNNVSYTWDCGSWTIIHTSALGDTLIYEPSKNAQEISLTVFGSCEEKEYEYQVNRVLSSADTIIAKALSNTCQASNSSVEFSVAGVPEGTVMEWSVSGTGWSIPASEVNSTSPTVTVGTEPGTLSVRTKSCDYTISRIIYIQPNTPGVITGASCLTLNDTTNKIYQIASVANADLYEWTYPSEWSVVGSATDTSITLKPSGTNAGTIQVRAKGCSNSAWRTKTLSMYGTKPTGFSSSQTCINVGLSDTLTYTVTGGLTGQTYGWKIDSDFGVIHSATADSSVIVIYTTGTEGTYDVLVCSHTNCGYSDYDTTSISIQGLKIETFLQKTNVDGIYYRLYAEEDEYGDPIWDPRDYSITWILNDTIVTGSRYQDQTMPLRGGLIESITDDFYVLIDDPSTNCITKRMVENASAKSSILRTDLQKIEEEDNSRELVIFPNPTNSILNISLPKEGNADVIIVDYSGRVVKMLGSQPQNFTVDVSSFSNGIYIIVAFQNRKRLSCEFIKR